MSANVVFFFFFLNKNCENFRKKTKNPYPGDSSARKGDARVEREHAHGQRVTPIIPDEKLV